MNVTDPSSKEATKIDWQHFDGSSGRAHIAEWQYLEGEHTIGASKKARITVEFTGLVLPGMTGLAGDGSFEGAESFQWFAARNTDTPGDETYVDMFSVGQFWISEDPGMPSFNASYVRGSENVGMPIGANIGVFLQQLGDISNEVFTLQVILDKTYPDWPHAVTCGFDLRSQSLEFIDNYVGSGGQPGWVGLPDTFKFYFGGKMPWGARGPKRMTVTKFFCEDIA